MKDWLTWFISFGLLAGLLLCSAGCGWMAVKLGDSAVQRLTEQVEAAKAQAVEAQTQAARLETKLAKKLGEIKAVAPFPYAVLIGLVIFGGIAFVVARKYAAPLAGPVAVVVAGLCLAVILKTYLLTVIVVTAVVAGLYGAYLLLRYFQWFKDVATDKTGKKKGLTKSTQAALAAEGA
ncbi:MAG TPA: hypothetical protein VMW52_01970 [Phycisphaerae bacterium]|nr:hypothetical protein [Phycisphaerae bacterium]